MSTSTATNYVRVVKPIALQLKAAKPDVQLSIPLAEHSRNSFRSYNRTLVDDLTYFDAISVHVYLGSDPFNPNNRITFADILTGRLDLEEHVEFPRSFAPDKPVWLSEWGYDGSLPKNAASALGMADCFLYLFEHQDVFERANWFAANEELNGFVDVENIKEVVYPITKTPYGSVYEIIRSVFENSTLLEGDMTAPRITTSMGSMNAVSARAVVKEDQTVVFAVNLTDKAVPFTLTVDGISTASERFVHDAYQFSSLDQTEQIPFATSPLTNVKTGTGDITLPSLSVSKIVFDNRLTSVNDCAGCPLDLSNRVFPNPSSNGFFEIAQPAKWKVFTLTGVKIAEGQGSSIDLSGFAAGAYLVNLDGRNNIKVVRK